MLAKIYRPSKSAMQSGKAGMQHWVLEFERSVAPHAAALMGWTGSADTALQVRLSFESLDEAVDFARRHEIPHQVAQPRQPKRILRAYGDNFAYSRKEPWSH
jgi:hypothetical protein